MTGLALLTLPARADAASADQPSELASTQLSGQVVRVEREDRPGQDSDPQTLLQLPGGQLTPVDGIELLPSGSTVDLTVTIPRALEDEVRDDAGDAALIQARDVPAGADSDVARASTDAAAADNIALPAAAISHVAPDTAATTPSAQQVSVAVVGVDGYAASAYSDSVVSSLVSSASTYWSGQSGGSISFSQSGSPTRYTSSIACSNASALWNEAATRTGFSAGANRHLVVFVPLAAYSSGDCGYGLGTVGSSVSSGGMLYVADASWPALAHELGHNMSLWHANKLACGSSSYDSLFDASGDPTATGCSVTEYGDGMDVMASSALDDTGGLSSIGLMKLGLLPPSQLQTLTSTGTTTATLIPLSSGPAASGIRAVSITDPRNSNVYVVENRQNSGQDSYGWLGIGNRSYSGHTTGYGLRVLKRGEGGASVLLDPTPSASGLDTDAVVPPGTAFLSASGGIWISSVQNSDGSVTAAIDLAAAGQTHGGPAPSGGGGSGGGGSGTTQVATTTTVTAPARMLANHSYAISGSVSAIAGTPTGTVTLTLGDDVQPVTLSGSGLFTTSYTPTEAGDLSVVAQYQGSSAFQESSGSTASTVLASESTPAISVSAPGVPASARSAQFDVQVTAAGHAASGTVRLLDQDGHELRAATLNTSGQVRLSLLRPEPGRHHYSIDYSGDGTTNSATEDVSLVVGRYSAAVRTDLGRDRISARQTTSVTVTVTSAASPVPTGRVTLTGSRNSTLSVATLRHGRATLTVPRGLATGRQYLRVVYSGSSTVAPSISAPIALRVVR